MARQMKRIFSFLSVREKKVLAILALLFGMIYAMRPWIGWYIGYYSTNIGQLKTGVPESLEAIRIFASKCILDISPIIVALYIVIMLVTSFESKTSILTYTLLPINFALVLSLLAVCIPVGKDVYYPTNNWAYSFTSGNYFIKQALSFYAAGILCFIKSVIIGRRKKNNHCT